MLMKNPIRKQNIDTSGGFFVLDIIWPDFTGKKRVHVRDQLKNKLNPQMRDWILPPWFERQNNPLEKPYAAGVTDFVNLTSRNWVALYAENMKNIVLVDLYGTVHLPGMGISMETWIRDNDEIYTPGRFISIQHRLCPLYRGMGLTCEYVSGACKIIFFPAAETGKPLIQTQVSIIHKRIDSLKPVGLLFVIRPFDHNGMAWVKSLEYRERNLLVNGKKILSFEKEPSFSFFSHAGLGDVTRYFESGEGNEKIRAIDGSCTGMLGFTGLPEELKDIRLSIATGSWDESLRPYNFFSFYKMKHAYDKENINWVERLSQSAELIKTHTKLDEMYTANLAHLKTFSYITDEINIYQILTYNRFNMAGKSKIYLETWLKRVRWDGAIHEQLLGTSQLVHGILDYCQLTGDVNFIKSHWLVLERIGSWMMASSMKLNGISENMEPSLPGRSSTYEYYFWICAGLKALAKLGTLINRITEVQDYKEAYLSLKGGLLQSFTNTVRLKKHKAGSGAFDIGNGEQLARSLSASYPLQLFDINERVIRDALDLVLRKYLYNGAVISPLDFKGIDLELTAMLGQVLVREGVSYSRILNSLLTYAGPAWSWPDRVNPVSREGIGKIGHDAKVLYQVLLFLRSIMAIEDDETLYLLPGVFTSCFWKEPRVTVKNLPTYFGNLSFQCSSLGSMVQIDYQPEYHLRPNKVRLLIPITCKVLFCDKEMQYRTPILEVNPDFHLLRIRRE